ncbi:MAG: adenylate kinase [Bacteroidetes bacterium]|nr:adenylate kinase [Bacteroidota bacterium]MCY4205941.1 adenylate kinase [Bacteroidota bacterium]
MVEQTNPNSIVGNLQLVFLGPPGSGKGTQARLLAAEYGFRHISTGVILRGEIKAGTPIGREAKKYIEGGRLAPDHVVRILAENAIKAENNKRYILDGYPRTVQQAIWLSEFMNSQKSSLTAVINFEINSEEVVSRLSQRRIHSVTGENFHLSNKPPPEEQAEFIITRPDDQPSAIRKRLKIYDQQTRPLVDFYSSKNLLVPVSASGSFSDVTAEIRRVLHLP